MKTKTWILILMVFALLSFVGGILLLLPSAPSAAAEIYSHGKLIRIVDLNADQQFQVSLSGEDYNIITVKDGKIAVTAATCPDHYCMHRGYCHSGAPIVCLPNALEIRFLSSSGPDFSIG